MGIRSLIKGAASDIRVFTRSCSYLDQEIGFIDGGQQKIPSFNEKSVYQFLEAKVRLVSNIFKFGVNT